MLEASSSQANGRLVYIKKNSVSVDFGVYVTYLAECHLYFENISRQCKAICDILVKPDFHGVEIFCDQESGTKPDFFLKLSNFIKKYVMCISQ